MSRRTNFFWGVALLGAALVLILNALDVLPPGLYDILARSWPALLVLLGLSILLRARIAFGGLLALVVSVALVGGITALAFSSRASQPRDDYQQAVEQVVADNVTLLRVRLDTLATDIDLRAGPAGRVISGLYSGSLDNSVQLDYSEDSGAADFRLTETRSAAIPLLENVGRGTLRLEIPPDLPVDIELLSTDGRVVLNSSGLALERLNVNVAQGTVLVTLPVYDPLGSQPDDTLGTLAVRQGDMTLFIPPEVSARLDLSGSAREPIYDPTIYNLLFGGTILEARNIDTGEIVMRYNVVVPNGQVRVEVPNNTE